MVRATRFVDLLTALVSFAGALITVWFKFWQAPGSWQDFARQVQDFLTDSLPVFLPIVPVLFLVLELYFVVVGTLFLWRWLSRSVPPAIAKARRATVWTDIALGVLFLPYFFVVLYWWLSGRYRRESAE